MQIVLPPGLDPATDHHGARIAGALAPPGGVPAPLPPGMTYVFIVFSNRSGSTYLGELLASTGFFNRAQEPLNADGVLAECRARGLTRFDAYFAAVAAERSRNAHFVVKASVGQLAVLAAHGILGRILDDARFLLVERMDKVAQVVSWRIAVQTGRFTSYHAPDERPPPVYDGAALRRELAGLIALHAQMATFFALNGIVPCHVTYEALTARPRMVGEQVCGYLGCPDLVCDPGRIGMQRQATELNAAWCRRFVAEQRQEAG